MKTKSLLISTLFAAASMVAANATDYTWTHLGSTTWDTSSYNWQDDSGNATYFGSADTDLTDANAIFGTTETTQTVVLSIQQAVGNVTIQGGYEFADGGETLTGTSLTLEDGATLTVSGDIAFETITNVWGGYITFSADEATWEKLEFTSGGTISVLGDLTVENLSVGANATIDNNSTGTLVVNKISGSAQLELLQGASIVINGVDMDNTNGLTIKTQSTGSSVTFNLGEDESISYSQNNASDGSKIYIKGAGTVYWSGYLNAYTNILSFGGGTLVVNGSSAGTGNRTFVANWTDSEGTSHRGEIFVTADSTLDLSVASYSFIGNGYAQIDWTFENGATLNINSTTSKSLYVINNNLYGDGTIQLSGSVTLQLGGGTGANAFGTISNGALTHNVGLKMGSGTFLYLVAAASAAFAWLEGDSGSVIRTNGKTVYVYSSKDSTFSGAFWGGGTLVKGGDHTLTLNGTSSHTGGTSVVAGTLNLAAASTISGTVTMTGGELLLSIENAGAAITKFDISNAVVAAEADQTLAATEIALARNSSITSGDATTTSTLTLSKLTTLSATLGTDEIATNLNLAVANSAISVSDGASLSISGTVSTDSSISAGTLSKAGAGTLSLDAKNAGLTHAFSVLGGSVILGNANALANAKSVSLAKATTLSSSDDVSDVVFNGTINNAGVMTLTNGVTFNNAVTNSGTMTLGGTVVFNTVSNVDNMSTIALTAGTTVTNLAVAGGTVSVDASVSAENVSLSSLTLQILADAVDTPDQQSDFTAATFTGTFAWADLTINLGKVVFSKDSLTKIVFDLTSIDDAVVTSFFSALQAGTIGVSGIEGSWDITDDGNKILFTASASNTILWSGGTGKASGTWTAAGFNGQSTQQSSIIGFDSLTGTSTVAVTVTGSIGVGDILVFSGDTSYTLNGATSSVTADSLRMTSGSLTLNTKLILTSDEGASIVAGTLNLASAGALTLATKSSGDRGAVTMSGGTLIVGNANAFSNNSAINMVGGTTLQFVHGAVVFTDTQKTTKNVEIHISSATSKRNPVVLEQVAGLGAASQDQYFAGISSIVQNSYVEFRIGEGTTLEFVNGAALSTRANFIKTGEGTLILRSSGTLAGTLYVEGGTAALGAAGDNGAPVFQGNIVVGTSDGATDATLQLIDTNSFSVDSQAAATITVYENAQVLIAALSEGESAASQIISAIKFNLVGGEINSTGANDAISIIAKDLQVAAAANYESGIGAMLIRLDEENAATFDVGADGTLLVNATFMNLATTEGTGFTKTGAGTMILASTLSLPENNTTLGYLYAGTIDVQGGTLQIGDGSSTISTGTLGEYMEIKLADDTVLKADLGDGNTYDFDGTLSGTGELVVSSGTFIATLADGGRTLDLGASYVGTFAGDITIEEAGTLLIRQTGVYNSITNDVTLAGTLGVADSRSVTIDGTVTIVGSNATIDSGANGSGLLTIKHLASTEENPTLTVSGSVTDVTLSENLDGKLSLTITGGATAHLSAAASVLISGSGALYGAKTSITLEGTGTKTLAGVTVLNDLLTVSTGSTLVIQSTVKSGSADGTLEFAGTGKVQITGTLNVGNLILSQTQTNATANTLEVGIGNYLYATTATINGGRIDNQGLISIGNATVTANTTIVNSSTITSSSTISNVSSSFNVNDGVTLTISGGTLGWTNTTTTISGGGTVSLQSDAVVKGSLVINDATVKLVPTSTTTQIELSEGSTISVNAGTLQSAVTIATDTTDALTLVNGASVGGNVEIKRNDFAETTTTTTDANGNTVSTTEQINALTANSSTINGNVSLNSVNATMSNVTINGILSLIQSLSAEQEAWILADHDGEVDEVKAAIQAQIYAWENSVIPDYITITNDASIGGITAKQLNMYAHRGYSDEYGFSCNRTETDADGTVKYISEWADYTHSPIESHLEIVLENEDAIGAEYAFFTGKIYSVTNAGQISNAITSVDFNETTGVYTLRYNEAGSNGGQIKLTTDSDDLYLDISSDGIIVKRAGALVWNNLTGTWSSANWELTQKNADNITGQNYADYKYVSVNFSGAAKTLTLDMNAQVNSLNFVGGTATSTMTFDQAGYGISGYDYYVYTGTDLTLANNATVSADFYNARATFGLSDDDFTVDTTTGTYTYTGADVTLLATGAKNTVLDALQNLITLAGGTNTEYSTESFEPVLYVESGRVIINNLGQNDFSKAIIAEGATLTVNTIAETAASAYALSGNEIQLAGTLAFNTDYVSTETLTAVGSTGTVSVASGKEVSLGKATGTTATLTKTGAGTLNLAGDSDVGIVNVSAGTLIFGDDATTSDELGVATLNVLANASAEVNSSVTATALSLGENASLTLNNTSNTLTTLAIADGATLTATSPLTLGDGAAIAATGTSNIAATLAQAGAVTLDIASGAILTVDNWTSTTDAVLRKTGSGRLTITDAALAGTTIISAGTLAYGNTGTISTGDVAVNGASTLMFLGAGDVTFGATSTDSTLAGAQGVTVTLSKSTSGTLTLNTNLSIAGTLSTTSVKGGLIIAGASNAYNTIVFNNLTFADGAGATTAGTLSATGTNAKLNIAGTTTGNLGNISLATNLALTVASGGSAQFGELSGSRTLTVSGAGTIGLDSIAKTAALKLTNGTTVELASGTIGKAVVAATGTTLKKVDADYTLVVEAQSNDFAGALVVDAGTLLLQNGGSFANAAMTINDAGTTWVELSADASVGDTNAISATLAGTGTLAVSGEHTFSFAENSASSFTGTIYATNAATILVDGLGASATLSLNGATLQADSETTLGELQLSYASSNLIIVDDEDLTINSISYSTTAAGAAGTLYFINGNGDTIVNGNITDGLNISIASDGDGVVKLAGTNELNNVAISATGTLQITETTTVAGTISLDGGTIQIENMDSTDTLNFDSDFVSTNTKSLIQTIGDIALTGTTIDATTGEEVSFGDIAGFAGTIEAVEGTLSIAVNDAQLANNSQTLLVDEGAMLALTINNENALQGKAVLAGAGTINLLGDGNLTLVSANDDFTGTINVTNNLTLQEAATLGTATVVLASNATLTLDATNKALVIDAGAKVTGTNGYDATTSIIKTGTATAYAGDVTVGTIDIQQGTLAVNTLTSNATVVSFAVNTTLETGKTLNENGELVSVSSGTRAIATTYKLAGNTVTFSHDSNYGQSVISGRWADNTNPTTNKLIELAGGGVGSYFQLNQGAATIKKTGSGTWVLTETLGTGNVSVRAGTLEIQKFANNSQEFSINEASTLEISGFNSGNELTGTITGSGTLKISGGGTDADPVTIGEITTNGGTWILDVATYVELTADFSQTIAVEKTGVLRFNADSNADFTYNGIVYATSGSVEKVGTGTLTLGSNFDLTGAFDINAGTVVVTSQLGTSQEGLVTIAQDATLAFSGDTTLNKEIAGSGTLEFVSGTTTVTLNSYNFDGSVKIDADATIVYSLPSGLSSDVSVGLGSKISGAGTVQINAKNASTTTTWTSDATAADQFTGTIEIIRGTLALSLTELDNLNTNGATVTLKATSNAANAILTLTGTDNTVLSDLPVDTIQSANKSGEVQFDKSAILTDAGFVDDVNIRVVNGTTLTSQAGYANNDLYVDYGGTLVVQNAAGTTSSISGLSFFGNSTGTNASTPLEVGGNLVVNGELIIETSVSSPIKVAGTATFSSSAEVVLNETPSDSVLVAASSVSKSALATFTTADGTKLASAVRNNGTTLVIGRELETPNLPGLENFVATLDSNQGNILWNTLNSAESDSERNAILRNFSPVSFGALIDLSLGIAGTQNDLLRQRLEQRRYDRAFPENFFKKEHMFYANAFGHSGETTAGTNKNPNYDIDYYGAQVGVDANLSAHALAGINVTYATGKADVHNHGGKHEIDSLRLGVYSQIMFDEQTYLGLGAHMGFDSFDTKRQNAFDSIESDTNGYNLGLSATFGRLFVINSEYGLHFSPYVGLDYDYVSIAKFREDRSAAGTSFDVDSFDRQSLRGTIGASFTWAPTIQWRVSIDVGYHHEFLDDHSEIDATFNSGVYNGGSANVKAYFANEDTLSIGPRVEYRLNTAWAINAGYTYETDFDETDSHSANIGFRGRF